MSVSHIMSWIDVLLSLGYPNRSAPLNTSMAGVIRINPNMSQQIRQSIPPPKITSQWGGNPNYQPPPSKQYANSTTPLTNQQPRDYTSIPQQQLEFNNDGQHHCMPQQHNQHPPMQHAAGQQFHQQHTGYVTSYNYMSLVELSQN